MMKNKHLPRIVVTILFFFFGGCFATWASRISTIKDFLSAPDDVWGLILFYAPIGSLASMSFSSFIIKNIGSKLSTLFGLILYLLALVGIGMCTNVLQIKIALFLFGLVSNFTNIAINTQATQVSKQYQRQIMGSFHGAWSIGGFVAAWFGGIMISGDINPFRHFSIYAVIGVVISLIIFRFMIADELIVKKNIKEKTTFALPNKGLILLGVFAFCAMLAEGTLTDWATIYMQRIVGAPEKYASYGLTAYMFTMASGRFISDFIVHKYGSKITLILSGIMILGGFLLSVFIPNFYVVIMAFMLAGFGISSVVPLAYSQAGRMNGVSPGFALSLSVVTTVGFVGFFLGPPVIGFISQHYSLEKAFILVSVMGLIIFALALKIKNKI